MVIAMLDEVTQYAKDVLEGKYITCKATKLACKRHLNDLERAKTEEFSYYFDVKEAKRVIKFSETLKLAEQGGINVKLKPFQKFCLGSLMGWRTKEGHNWRFRQSNISFARQNGKSFLNGDLMTYVSNFMPNMDYKQFYIGANNQKQAKIVFKEVVKFIDMDEDLQSMFKIMDYKSEITCLNTKSTIKALSRDSKIDGLRPTLGVIDEYHQSAKSDILDALKNGQGKLENSLISIISTAGSNLNYPYYAMYLYSKKVLKGEIEDDRIFIYICELDENDSIDDKSVYIKSNPLYSEKEIDMLYDDYLRAKEMSESQLVDFMTKRLNIWVENKAVNFLTLDVIEKMRSEETIESFKDKECVIGLDLSSISDLTSVSFVFKDWDSKGDEQYFIHSHSFLPFETFKKFRKKDSKWQEYVDNNELTLTTACQGLRLDYKAVITYIQDMIKTYNLKVKMLCYDSNNIGGILQDIEETLKVDSIAIAQSMKNLTEPTCNFEILAKAGQVKFSNNSLYEECLKNAVLISEYGESKLCKIDKKQPDRKIDCIDATIDAFKFVITIAKPKKKIDYSKIYEKLRR